MGLLILSFLAGILTSISPCILPILPLILGSALQKNKLGPFSIAMGLVFSFTFIGTSIVHLSSLLEFDPEPIRYFGAFILLLIGSSLLINRVQTCIQKILAPVSNLANKYSINYNLDSLLGNLF